MNKRFDWSNIKTEIIKKNIRILSKETAHLKNILESYKKKDDTSLYLLTDLERLLWQNRIIMDSQIGLFRKRQKGNIDCNEEPSECPFHRTNNNYDHGKVIVKIDVKDIKKATDHLEKIVEKYRNRKHISSGLLRMFEYFLSEYNEMI